MEISNSSFHKCSTNSDDSESDSPLHSQISSDSKTVRHFKTSQNSPSFPSLAPKHHVDNRCSLHREDFKYSVESTSYLHCESCSAIQNLKLSAATQTIPIKSKKIMGQHSTSGHIMSTPVRLSESESKFNLTAQTQNKDNSDDNEADVENKLLFKGETDHEDETNTEEETDDEDETDTEDEDKKDKKDPNDKSDPDGSDPKGGNSENNTDNNSGSDPSGASGPTSGPDSIKDGDSKHVTDHNNESDPAIDNASNSDVNLKYYTDLDNADLAEDVNQHNNADSKGSTTPNSASGNKNRTVLDYISGSNYDFVPRNDTGQRNNTYSETIRPISNSLYFIQTETDPKNNPGPQSSHGFPKYNESKYNNKPSNATSHNVVPNNISDSNYDTEPSSTASQKHTAAIKYYSDLNDITGFTYEVRSSFLVSPNYLGRKKYATIPSFALNTISVIDTGSSSSCTAAISSQFPAGKNYAPENRHLISHFNGFNIIIKNIQNDHNSSSTSHINILTDNELKASSISSSILKIVYGNISHFITGTNHTSYPDILITSEFCDPLEFVRAYIIFDSQNIGAQFQNTTGYMDSDTSKYATGSTDALDAKESGFLKDFSGVQNPIGNPSPFKILSNLNIPLHSFDVIVEAELPDVTKFAISSGAVNNLFKVSLYRYTFQIHSQFLAIFTIRLLILV
ncbi:hypothetical protein LEMLEM_LOCUS17827 [Lemmus lemmus]